MLVVSSQRACTCLCMCGCVCTRVQYMYVLMHVYTYVRVYLSREIVKSLKNNVNKQKFCI